MRVPIFIGKDGKGGSLGEFFFAVWLLTNFLEIFRIGGQGVFFSKAYREIKKFGYDLYVQLPEPSKASLEMKKLG